MLKGTGIVVTELLYFLTDLGPEIRTVLLILIFLTNNLHVNIIILTRLKPSSNLQLSY